ncbi:FecR domain-containing protein [Pedobacter sp. ASV1-7]|uniref:FecR family protein n=1 Tax=Pedobacter sp. ASV1-7 TaxID=3145237 RepID=UPI0032E8F791
MNKEEILELINKYNEGKCNADEISLLESWYLTQDSLYHKELDEQKIEQDLDQVFKQLPKPIIRKLWWPRVVAAAAIVVLCAGIVVYNNFFKTSGLAEGQRSVYKNDIFPGGNKAVLTLANGQRISLDSTKQGIVINTTLTYNDGTAITSSGKTGNDTKQLSMQTPRGGQYRIVLPDGTKVWLNAGSSIKFPSTFSKAEIREIELKGEAYFEVAKVFLGKTDAGKKGQRMPFIVRTALQDIQVLGTHINVNAYADEPVTATTLIEGVVGISSNGRFAKTKQIKPVILKPGEQAGTDNKGQLIVKDVDTEQILAWKNDYFMFKDEPIQSIMRKLSRWYDIDVSYEGDLSDLTFLGVVSKSKNISTVLKVMESTGSVHFKIEGRRVIVKR